MNTIDPMQHTGLIHMVLNTNPWLYNQSSCWTRDDAYQEAMIALIEALQGYDGDQSTVASYCIPRIKWGLYRAHREQQGLIRKPGHLHELQAKYKKIQLEFIQNNDREPEVQEMARRMKMTVQELQRFLNLFTPIQSLDAPVSEAEDLTLADTIEDERDHFSTAETRLHLAKLRKDLQRMMDERLTAPDQKLLKEYYAWDGGKQPTIKALADKNNFSAEVTRGKIQRALTGFNKFRPELVRHYPDIIMSQIYNQNRKALGDLKKMSVEMLQTYLHPGDLVQINQYFCVITGVDSVNQTFTHQSNNSSFSVPFKKIIDFEMKDGKVTRIFKRLSNNDKPNTE